MVDEDHCITDDRPSYKFGEQRMAISMDTAKKVAAERVLTLEKVAVAKAIEEWYAEKNAATIKRAAGEETTT